MDDAFTLSPVEIDILAQDIEEEFHQRLLRETLAAVDADD